MFGVAKFPNPTNDEVMQGSFVRHKSYTTYKCLTVQIMTLFVGS